MCAVYVLESPFTDLDELFTDGDTSRDIGSTSAGSPAPSIPISSWTRMLRAIGSPNHLSAFSLITERNMVEIHIHDSPFACKLNILVTENDVGGEVELRFVPEVLVSSGSWNLTSIQIPSHSLIAGLMSKGEMIFIELTESPFT
jgi:hypothetical protein